MKHRADQMPTIMQANGIELRGEDWGGMAVRRMALPAGADFTPTLQGLPDDLCPCPHWGYVLDGSIHIRYTNGTMEVSRAGDAYYLPEGHTVWTDDGAVLVELSPEPELRRVISHIEAVMAG